MFKNSNSNVLAIIIFCIIIILYLFLIICNLIFIKDKTTFMFLGSGLYIIVSNVVFSLKTKKRYKYLLIILSYIMITILYYKVLNSIYADELYINRYML